MSFETREEVLERVMKMPKPACPHCQKEMNIWEDPPINFSDGLGWGTPYLFVCFNDECPLFVRGWGHLEETYAHRASYRCMNYPGTEQYECMPVFSDKGGTGQIMDEQLIAEQEAMKEAIKAGFNMLAECFVRKDGPTVLNILMDPIQPGRVRLKAAEIIGDIGELEAVDPIRNLKFGNDVIQQQVDASIKKIHERNFTRECPFCAEIIKNRAKICKHCGKEVAGQ